MAVLSQLRPRFSYITSSVIAGMRGAKAGVSPSRRSPHVYVYHRTLSPLPHDFLPTLEPGTRSRISERFMAWGDETPRAHQEDAPRAGGRSPRPSCDVCAELLRLEVLWKPEAFPDRRLGLPRRERFGGVSSEARSGPGKSTVIYFLFGRTIGGIPQLVCTE